MQSKHFFLTTDATVYNLPSLIFLLMVCLLISLVTMMSFIVLLQKHYTTQDYLELVLMFKLFCQLKNICSCIYYKNVLVYCNKLTPEHWYVLFPEQPKVPGRKSYLAMQYASTNMRTHFASL